MPASGGLLSEYGLRQDGRLADQLRQVQCRLGAYRQADGSAYLEQGNTKVLAAVYGPREPRYRSKVLEGRCFVNCQYSMATFSTTERKFRPRGDRRSQQFKQHLQKTFESTVLTSAYPRSQIDIFCEILQTDGSNLAACINASTLALVDAGIPIKGLVSACCVSSVQLWNGGGEEDGPATLVDLSGVEESDGGRANSKLTMALLPLTDEIVLLELSESRLHFDYLERTLEAAQGGAKQMHAILQAAVKDRLAALVSI